MKPTTDRERIVLLDTLRGVAIFGMFTVNMTADLPWGSTFREQPLNVVDNSVMIFVDLLTNGKFITIFSFLFGIGFFLQLERASELGVPFLAIYLKRLVALFLIAALAIVAGLGAHILIEYAMLGLLLPLIARRSTRFLIGAIVVCFSIGVIFDNSELVAQLNSAEQPRQVELVDDSSSQEGTRVNLRDQAYGEGSFTEIASYSASNLLGFVFSWNRLGGAPLLGLMLLGCYVCRCGALKDSTVRVKMARTALPWLLSVGGFGMVIFVWSSPWPNADTELLSLIGNFAFWPVGAPVLGLGYVAIITLMMEKGVCLRILLPFAHVGRMALTNYLFHGFVIAVFTYQWGFGLYGEMGPFWGLVAVFAIFPLMIITSSWWIRRFQFGPMEWLWRTLTYGHIQPLRNTESDSRKTDLV
jgi:uncharacterized protein